MIEISLKKEQLIEMFRNMLRIRRFEEKVSELCLAGKIPGSSPHLYIGEEAVAVGICANLRKDDYVTSGHRAHGHCIAKGVRMDKLMAELLGKRDGCNGGRGGTMHIVDLSVGFLGANGIVGAGIPIAVGAGLSARLRGTDQVAVCFFGDGAANQGTFHEGINMAAVWKLPVIFVCENNLYSTWTPVRSVTSVEDIAERAKGYGIPGIIVDGMDVIKVYEAGRTAIQRAREGKGPTLIECKTYRFTGHYVGDPGMEYRPREEIEAWMKRDPIKKLQTVLLESKQVSMDELKKIEEQVAEEVEKAVEYALNSPFPSPEEAIENVFCEIR